MDKEQILQLAEKAGLLNHHELTTPTDYFVSGNADVEEVLKFAELIIDYYEERIYEKDAFIDDLYNEIRCLSLSGGF